MVSCEPYQSYKVQLKRNGQSIIEHNLVTICFNLEISDNDSDTTNLLVHIFDKKTSTKPCKSESSMSYIQQNQSSLLVNSIHHHHHQQQNFGSTYQPQYHHYHHSSIIKNEPTTTTITAGDHNDVSSTTTTVVFSALQPPSTSTCLTPNSSPTCSSSNQQYLSSQQIIQIPSSNTDSQMSPITKTISHTSSNNIPTKQTSTNVIDLQQSPPISSYPLATSSVAPSLKTFVCNCSKPHLVHEHTCPALSLLKQQSNTTLTSQTIVCRPPINRSIAQRAAVASQIRTNRAISMTPIKDQGQTLLPLSVTNMKISESSPNITTIVSQQQSNVSTVKKPIVRQRSVGSINIRQKKKTTVKQISVPNDQTLVYNSNDTKQQSIAMIKEEFLPTSNPTIKLVSPLSIQTTVSNSEIDQTIDDVINGKGEIPINDRSQIQTKLPQQPSSQLVWVQNGTVTTKTWLSPLYQKQQQQQQQQQQSVFDPIGSALTHQDVVNIAQQVIFPTTPDDNQTNTILQTSNTINSKKRNRSKSTNNTTPKRNRKPTLNRPHSTAAASSQQEIHDKPVSSSPITPTLNLINKSSTWLNTSASSSGSLSVTTNTPIPNSNQHLSSFDKNDSWQTQFVENVENVDGMLDEFQLVSIDEQRINPNNHFDFDISSDGFLSKPNHRFGSLTPPPPLTTDNQRFQLTSNDKLLNSSQTNSRLLTGGDVDVYEHFLNPYGSSIWQENQVTSSVATPPDFPIQQTQQQYFNSQTNDEQFDSYNLQSQTRLLFDVQS